MQIYACFSKVQMVSKSLARSTIAYTIPSRNGLMKNKLKFNTGQLLDLKHFPLGL